MASFMTLDRSLDKVFLTLIAGAAVKNLMLYLLSRRHRRLVTRVRVGKISRITFYPVKSLRGVDVEEAKCETFGLVTQEGFRDRSLMVCNDKYKMVTGRQYPRLVLIRPTVEAQTLTLEADGIPPLKIQLNSPQFINKTRKVEASVWGQPIEALDCGDEAGDWLCKYVGTSGLRLVYHTSDMTRRLCSEGDTSWHKQSTSSDQVIFQDGFPLMMMCESSVEALNGWLPEGKVAEMSQFRPNLVVSGSRTFDEDRWRELHIGDGVFSNIKPCSRCIFTTVSTTEGKKDEQKEPLMTLRKHRMTEPELEPSPCIGINLVVHQAATLRVGDEIWATYKY